MIHGAYKLPHSEAETDRQTDRRTGSRGRQTDRQTQRTSKYYYHKMHFAARQSIHNKAFILHLLKWTQK